MLVVAASLMGSGCGGPTVYYTQVVRPSHAMVARSPDQVEVFVVTPPARAHRDVGILQVTDIFVDDAPTYTRLLRNAAAKLGCDAVLITGVQRVANRYTSPSVEASCEVFTDGPGDGPAAIDPVAAKASSSSGAAQASSASRSAGVSAVSASAVSPPGARP